VTREPWAVTVTVTVTPRPMGNNEEALRNEQLDRTLTIL
jgi:hypothetical protein